MCSDIEHMCSDTEHVEHMCSNIEHMCSNIERMCSDIECMCSILAHAFNFSIRVFNLVHMCSMSTLVYSASAHVYLALRIVKYSILNRRVQLLPNLSIQNKHKLWLCQYEINPACLKLMVLYPWLYTKLLFMTHVFKTCGLVCIRPQYSVSEHIRMNLGHIYVLFLNTDIC